jgi:L,D-transpeptidase YnhG
MCRKIVSVAVCIWLLCAVTVFCAEISPAGQHGSAAIKPSNAYSIEISISGNRLTLFETNSGGERTVVAQYPVGSVARGLATYPLGIGKVTGIFFDPWWYPTPYSRQVFRSRGIELPSAVPPGDPLNYMGAVKIALSHKTWKGAIYRIHGNNDPKRVGRRVTGGCFVMYNEDSIALARKIKVGTEVNILP